MNLLEQYRQLLSLKDDSDANKQSIMISDEYLAKKALIEDLEQELKQMTVGCVNYDEVIQEKAQEIITEMESQGVTGTNLVEIKYKEHKRVNPLALKHVLDDEDAFMTLIDIKQSVVKDFAKDNEALKKPLYSCIEVVKREAVGLILKD